MRIFDEQRNGKKITWLDFSPILSGYTVAKDGCLKVTLLTSDKKEAMEMVLKNMDDRYYFDRHKKNPFTYEYSECDQTFIIKPEDVSIHTILDELLVNDLIQLNEIKSSCSPS